MPHQLSVSDELWDLYDGSGMEMRDVLWREKSQPITPPPVVVNGRTKTSGPWGTLFFARKLTSCTLCQARVYPYMPVVMTSWTKRTEDGPVVGPAAAVHLECAIRNGIEVQWTVERVLGDLRQIISRIPKRKLKKAA